MSTTTTGQSLPRNFRANLGTFSMDQLATAYTIVHGRAVSRDRGTVARTRAMNLAADINEEAFVRGFRFVLCGDGTFSFERYREAV